MNADADIVIFDPSPRRIVKEEFFVSKGKNSCFLGMEMYGEVRYTFVSGNMVYPFRDDS